MSYTLVTFHAHPDDEAITTAGTMMPAKAEGHHVVLVVATRGELGETPTDMAPGEQLADRRVAETMRAAEIMGIDRVAFLGYYDSGMAGEDTNAHGHSFAAAPVEEAAQRLAAILREENADVLTVYDENGGYGHPDHIQVHRVGRRAAELAGTPQIFECTINREHFLRLMAANPEMLNGEAPSEEDLAGLGVPEDQITTFIDGREFAERKRAAMAAHASQIPGESFFLMMPDEAFREAFGWEWFIRREAAPGTREESLFDLFAEL